MLARNSEAVVSAFKTNSFVAEEHAEEADSGDCLSLAITYQREAKRENLNLDNYTKGLCSFQPKRCRKLSNCYLQSIRDLFIFFFFFFFDS